MKRQSITRRAVVGSLAATGLIGSLRGIPHASAQASRFETPLAIPPLLSGETLDNRRRYALHVQPGVSEFLPGVKTPTIGVNGPYLGPTVQMREGDDVEMVVTNGLREPTTLHWHGLHVPAAQDGGPHQVIPPGGTWSPRFRIKQGPSTCWYHSHLMGRTGEQVLRGLAGLIQIEGTSQASLDLPSEYGVDDVPVVIQDRRFAADGSFAYISSMADVMMGYRGDTILVNGTLSPYLTLRRRLTRLRILNGSNARFYNLGRKDGAEMTVIGVDGGMLDTPARLRRLRLAPGERAEVVIEAEAGGNVMLMGYPISTGRGMGGMMMGGGEAPFPILELRAGKLETSPSILANRLAAQPAWFSAKASRTRTFDLEMGMMGGGMGRGMGHGSGMRGGMAGAGQGHMMGINGRAMDLSRIDERVPLGAIEIWEVRNRTPIDHPFHIHDVQFRIIDRDGQPPRPEELGLKDTVVVEAGGVVRVMAEFADFADPVRPYMYHCHILEHEDAGMMGQFVVV
ncbi:MAG: multicopper oxidase family protein [Hyphomicrobiaceae bacterium]